MGGPVHVHVRVCAVRTRSEDRATHTPPHHILCALPGAALPSAAPLSGISNLTNQAATPTSCMILIFQLFAHDQVDKWLAGAQDVVRSCHRPSPRVHLLTLEREISL